MLRRVVAALPLAGAVLAVVPGCEMFNRPELNDPVTTISPYPPETGDRLWAVLPARNESGTSLPEPLAIGDKLVASIEEVEGLRALAMNRTLAALREAEIETVSSPAEARRVAELLGVDGLVISSITAYDPYNPPIIGLSLALYSRQQESRGREFDPKKFAAQPRPRDAPLSGYSAPPSATYSAHLDARNHEVLQRVKSYALGRHDPEHALGWRQHLASMDLYTRFAAHEAIAGLLTEERQRVSPELAAERP